MEGSKICSHPLERARDEYYIIKRVHEITSVLASGDFRSQFSEPYGYIKLDVDGTVTGTDACGNTVTAFPVRGGVWEPTLFQSVTAIGTATKIWVGFNGPLVKKSA
jgi:hypothetical protein